jgi:hypothetical protein
MFKDGDHCQKHLAKHEFVAPSVEANIGAKNRNAAKEIESHQEDDDSCYSRAVGMGIAVALSDANVGPSDQQFHPTERTKNPPVRDDCAPIIETPQDVILGFESSVHQNQPENHSIHGLEIFVRPYDVILGRGKGSDHHSGNQMFKSKGCVVH